MTSTGSRKRDATCRWCQLREQIGRRRDLLAALNEWFYECRYEMHRGLAEMYLADERFTATFESVAPGLARYVHDAIVANADRHA